MYVFYGVLIMFCFGLASGFFIPAELKELVHKNNTSFADSDNTKEEMMLALQENSELEVIPLPYAEVIDNLQNKGNDLNENLILLEAIPKTNTQNERSFVYINKKFKSSKDDQFYKLNVIDHMGLSPKSYPVIPIYFGDFYQRFLSGGYVNQYTNVQSDRSNKIGPIAPTNNANMDGKCNVVTDDNMNKKNKYNYEKLEYLQLLKRPLLRGGDKSKNKFKVQYHKSLTTTTEISYPGDHVAKTTMPRYSFKPQHISLNGEYYGFPYSKYDYVSMDFHSNGYKPENDDVYNDMATEYTLRKPTEDDQRKYKKPGKNIQTSMQDRIMQAESKCNCNRKSTKPENRITKKHNCICQKKTGLDQKDMKFQSKKRKSGEEHKYNLKNLLNETSSLVDDDETEEVVDYNGKFANDEIDIRAYKKTWI